METLKHFKTILFGQEIQVFTDHKNLTYPNSDFASDRVLQQRLTLEEYVAHLNYVKGEVNILADALSRLPMKEIEKSFTILPVKNKRNRRENSSTICIV